MVIVLRWELDVQPLIQDLIHHTAMMRTTSPGRADLGGPVDDPLEESLRIIRHAEERGLRVRLIGGLGIRARVPGWDGGASRSAARRDIDLATHGRDARACGVLLTELGYEADTHYNALYGHKQLYFVDQARGRPVDVVIDTLEMCHRLDFRDRLTADSPTLPLADLLLSKLQVVRLNHKDVLDALVLLSRFPLTDDDRDGIKLGRILEFTSTDWGWWRTVTGNITAIVKLGPTEVEPSELGSGQAPFDPWVQLAELGAVIDRAPKSRRWRVRARIGERVKWYEEPEETEHGGP